MATVCDPPDNIFCNWQTDVDLWHAFVGGFWHWKATMDSNHFMGLGSSHFCNLCGAFDFLENSQNRPKIF